MDAIMFLKEKRRMCDSYGLCTTCPLYSWDKYCSAEMTNEPEEVIAIVEKWSNEHPQKTLKDDFLEKYPDAETNNYAPIVCAKSVYGSSVVNCGSYRSCTDCWNRPLSEEVSDGCN